MASFQIDNRGSSSVVSYVLVLSLVVATAGGSMYVFNTIDNPLGTAVEDTDFIVDRGGSDEHRLVYVGDDDLDASNVEVLEISGDESGETAYKTPSGWDNQSLEFGDVVVDDLTGEAGGDYNFDVGEPVQILGHENANYDEGEDELTSQSGGERLQTVEVRETDPDTIEDLDDEELEEILVDGDRDGNISINVG